VKPACTLHHRDPIEQSTVARVKFRLQWMSTGKPLRLHVDGKTDARPSMRERSLTGHVGVDGLHVDELMQTVWPRITPQYAPRVQVPSDGGI
jgi:hypothetical protein